MKLTKAMIKKMNRARSYEEKKVKISTELIREIENKFDIEDLETIKCDGISSENLAEEISCYIDYGEGSIEAMQKALECLKKE